MHYSKLLLSKLEGDRDVIDAGSLEVKVLHNWEYLKRDMTSGDIGIKYVKNVTHFAFWAFMRAN